MKNGEVLELYETLQRISQNNDLKLSVALGYMMAKNKEKLRQEATIIYGLRRDIIMEHGRVEGKDIIVPNEYIDEVNRKVNDLMEIENDVEITKVPVDLFENIELNMEDIEGLSNMLFLKPVIMTTGPANIEKTSD